MTAISATRKTLLQTSEQLKPDPNLHYVNHFVSVPEEASKVGLILQFHKEQHTHLFVALFDPNGFRGNRMKPAAQGDVVLDLWVSPDDSSAGALMGALPAGEWRVQVDIAELEQQTDYTLTVYADFDPVPQPLHIDFPADRVVQTKAGWYAGELHAHSTESDGKTAVAEVVNGAVAAGLDYLALTDHFTISHWRKLAPHLQQPIALLHSCEITSHHGHANLHGMTSWVDVYVDRDDWHMNDAADNIHAQGGLFCVNHAFSGTLGWRAYDFDFAKADLIEIYHHLEGINCVHQLNLWDSLLNRGYRVVGVAGIDSHHPTEGLHALGSVMTVIYADELSEAGLIAGLERGRVYVSKGAHLRFSASSGEHHAEMWEALPLGDDVTLNVAYQSDEDLNIFVLRDGLPLDMHTVEATNGEWHNITFTDRPTQPAYYRVELHSTYRDETRFWIQWRDHETMRALSNPIWVSA